MENLNVDWSRIYSSVVLLFVIVWKLPPLAKNENLRKINTNKVTFLSSLGIRANR